MMNSAQDIEFQQQRQHLVRQIQSRGVEDPAVLRAMLAVRREQFLPPDLQDLAYEDGPLPIGHEQTISQPFVVALMTAALELQPQDRVLEIGTGSGYAAAVLSHVAREVFSVERHQELAERAEACLRREGIDNVHIRIGDGSEGWQEHAPYDAIVATAGAPQVPPALLEQLRKGGRLVIPVGSQRRTQELLRIRKTGKDTYSQENLGGVRFVPLVGAGGWEEQQSSVAPRPR